MLQSTCIQVGRRMGLHTRVVNALSEIEMSSAFYLQNEKLDVIVIPVQSMLPGQAWLQGLSPGSSSSVALGALGTPA